MSKHHHKKNYRHTDQPHKGLTDHQGKRLKDIGAFVRGMRLAECKSQIEAAQGMGIGRATLQSAEYGENISLLSLFKIIDDFGMTLQEFFTEME